MATVTHLPTEANAAAAFERYAAMIRAINDEPTLRSDRSHCENLVRAQQVFVKLLVSLPPVNS